MIGKKGENINNCGIPREKGALANLPVNYGYFTGKLPVNFSLGVVARTI